MTNSWRPEITELDRIATLGDPSYPGHPTTPGTYVVCSLWRVSEWKDGAVFRTVFLRNLWVPMESQLATWIDDGTHFIINSVSTKDATKWMEAGYQVFVRVKD